DCGLPNVLSGGNLPYLQEMSELLSSSSSNVFGHVVKGFFCPKGSILPVPCPAGTFRSAEGTLTSHSCLNCPVNFFNPTPGQVACLPCGSEAVQPKEGQETCVCHGEGRVFQ
ncbi:unnamed protein product, partial [Eretmochelys imbricata]